MIRITIQEVADKYAISKDTLRYYEKEGLIGPVMKNKSGIREYQKKDLERIEFIKCMRSAGLSIQVLKKYIRLYERGAETKQERLHLLEEEYIHLKEKIEVMQAAYQKLAQKIKLYRDDKI